MALMAHTAGYGDLLRKGMLTWPAALLQGILTKDAE